MRDFIEPASPFVDAMKTLVASISIGAKRPLANYALPRMESWSHRHGFDFKVVREPLIPDTLPPHFNKLAIPARFPGYDRYVIIDDDLLISRTAPPPPSVGKGMIGLVPDDEQRHTTAVYVSWTGNTGFIVADAAAAPIFADALARGSDETIWGYADQSALNRSAWEAGAIEQLPAQWNFMPVIHHIVSTDCWPAWKSSRTKRLAYYLRLIIDPFFADRKKIVKAYGVHLVRAPYPRLFSFIMNGGMLRM